MPNQFGKWGGTVDTLANLSAIVTATLEDGEMRPVMENQSIYVLHKGSVEAADGETVVAADVAENKWHSYGSASSAVGYAISAPDPANPDGWSVHYHRDTTYSYTITRAWDGAAWVVVAATPIHGQWGTDPPVGGAMPGHIGVDFTNRVRYEWMDDLGTGAHWVNIGTFV